MRGWLSSIRLRQPAHAHAAARGPRGPWVRMVAKPHCTDRRLVRKSRGPVHGPNAPRTGGMAKRPSSQSKQAQRACTWQGAHWGGESSRYSKRGGVGGGLGAFWLAGEAGEVKAETHPRRANPRHDPDVYLGVSQQNPSASGRFCAAGRRWPFPQRPGNALPSIGSGANSHFPSRPAPPHVHFNSPIARSHPGHRAKRGAKPPSAVPRAKAQEGEPEHSNGSGATFMCKTVEII